MKFTSLLSTLTILLIVLSPSSRADNVLLTINDNNPSAVTITATGNFSSINTPSVFEYTGIDLVGFFLFVPTTGGYFTGTLTPLGSTNSYNFFTDDNYSSIYIDMNIRNSTLDRQVFSTTSAAFTGSATLDMSADARSLPNEGASGWILDGVQGANQGVIGDWKVVNAVPEPSTYALLGLGALVLVIACRRKVA